MHIQKMIFIVTGFLRCNLFFFSDSALPHIPWFLETREAGNVELVFNPQSKDFRKNNKKQTLLGLNEWQRACYKKKKKKRILKEKRLYLRYFQGHRKVSWTIWIRLFNFSPSSQFIFSIFFIKKWCMKRSNPSLRKPNFDEPIRANTVFTAVSDGFKSNPAYSK